MKKKNITLVFVAIVFSIIVGMIIGKSLLKQKEGEPDVVGSFSMNRDENLTQEELAALVNLSPTHVSVIERGLKVTKLDTFIAIANALDVSADTLLIDVVTHSVTGVTNELSEMIEKLPKEKQQRIINAVRALVE